MKGVANKGHQPILSYTMSHMKIPAFNIWEAAYRLEQTYVIGPAGTVFVSVVDLR